MRKLYRLLVTVLVFALGANFSAFAQEGSSIMNNFRPNNQNGLNVFETPKEPDAEFDGLKIRVGGDFALQFQGLSQTNSGDSLPELGSNLNLPTANLIIDVQLYDGVRMHLMTYLSSRHHTEAWVKGGYVQFDKLDFIQKGFLESIMDNTYIRVGLDEINFGDSHFRRTDNAKAIYNPFVGNYLMDAFTTEAFGEVVVQANNGFLGVLGVSNGKLNQSVSMVSRSGAPVDNAISIYGKLGFDKQVSEDLRLRLTGSFYNNNGSSTGTSLYGGDRAGSRYYLVMDGGDYSGRFNPRFSQMTAIQINPFVKMKGLEFFGIYEVVSNSSGAERNASGSFTQIGAEALYRFGSSEQLYIGGRYNSVSGEMSEGAPEQSINRINFGGGWFLTKNILTKLEYVNQQYEGEGWDGSLFQGGEFKGVMLEAAISF